MHLQIITIYCACDDFLKSQQYSDSSQVQMTRAEVMTTALVSAYCFHGHQQNAQTFLKEHGYIPHMLSKSRFNRRLHQIPTAHWHEVLKQLALPDTVYIVDSCPVVVCDNIRIPRCRIYKEEQYRGYCASKRRYFFGLKVHLLTNAQGKPVEVLLTQGSCADSKGLKQMSLSLPPQATLYADKAYNHYAWEEELLAQKQIHLVPIRKKNSKRPHPQEVTAACRRVRKRVETTFSQIKAHFAHHIHAVTDKGFELKILLTVLAQAIVG